VYAFSVIHVGFVNLVRRLYGISTRPCYTVPTIRRRHFIFLFCMFLIFEKDLSCMYIFKYYNTISVYTYIIYFITDCSFKNLNIDRERKRRTTITVDVLSFKFDNRSSSIIYSKTVLSIRRDNINFNNRLSLNTYLFFKYKLRSNV